MMGCKVSVIVPIYKVSAFIEKCSESLLRQTLDDVEFIFVDDASPDDSIEKLESVITRFPNRTENCRILRHESNKGLPSARNTGLDAASGEYIFHCDGDDWTDSQMLEELYSAAKENDADFVWCDFFISFEHNERYMKARSYSTSEELIRRGFLSGAMKYNVWNKFAKRSLYNGIRFPDGHPMGEDMTMILVAAKASTVHYVPKAYYHYVKLNAGAYTSSVSETKLNDILFNTKIVEEFLKNQFPGTYDIDIEHFKLSIKFPFLISDRAEDYHRWADWFPESNRYVLRNKELPLRSRLVQCCARYRLWGLVWLYNKLVYKVLYGVIYK